MGGGGGQYLKKDLARWWHSQHPSENPSGLDQDEGSEPLKKARLSNHDAAMCEDQVGLERSRMDRAGRRDGMREEAHGSQTGGGQTGSWEEAKEEEEYYDEQDERPRASDPEEEKRIAKLQR